MLPSLRKLSRALNTFQRHGRFDLDDALAELDRWARRADFVLTFLAIRDE